MEIIVSSHDNPHPKKLWDFINSLKSIITMPTSGNRLIIVIIAHLRVFISAKTRGVKWNTTPIIQTWLVFWKIIHQVVSITSILKWSIWKRWKISSSANIYFSFVKITKQRDLSSMEQIVIVIQQKTLSLQHTYSYVCMIYFAFNLNHKDWSAINLCETEIPDDL